MEKQEKAKNFRQAPLSCFWGSGGVPQRKGLRGFLQGFPSKKIFERMGMKKPQWFLPVRARLLKCPCAKKFSLSR